jgi:hypothetical protein
LSAAAGNKPQRGGLKNSNGSGISRATKPMRKAPLIALQTPTPPNEAARTNFEIREKTQETS